MSYWIRVILILLRRPVRSLSHVWLSAIPWTALWQVCLSFAISWSLLKLMFIETMIPSNHLILCHSLLLTSIFPSIRVFSSELTLCIRWPKYQSFSFSINPSNKYPVLISFRIDWFNLPAVQEILKSLLQCPNLKASIFLCSAFLMVQLSHLYTTISKIIAFDYTDLCQHSDAFAFQYAV